MPRIRKAGGMARTAEETAPAMAGTGVHAARTRKLETAGSSGLAGSPCSACFWCWPVSSASVYTGVATLTSMFLFGWLLLIGGVVGLLHAIQSRGTNLLLARRRRRRAQHRGRCRRHPPPGGERPRR